MSPFRALLRKELIDSLRDRRTLVLMVVVPILLYPGLLALMGSLVLAGREWLAKMPLEVAVVSDEADVIVRSVDPPAHTSYVRMGRARAEAALREKTIAAFVDVDAAGVVTTPDAPDAPGATNAQRVVQIVYTKRHDRSLEALERMRKVLKAASTALLTDRLARAELPPTFAEPLKINELDLEFQQALGPLIASRLLPVILLVMLFMGALYPAIDVTAGEKERGTLETLLVAPVRPLEVMAAKYLTVTFVACVTTLINLGAMALTFRLGLGLGGESNAHVRFTWGQVTMMLGGLLPAALLVSGLSLAIASLARSFKEGQMVMTPLLLAGTVPGLLTAVPGIELNVATALVPLLNVALLIKAAVLGELTPLHIALTVSSTALCAVGALALAANAFRSESLRFGGVESWRALFGLSTK